MNILVYMLIVVVLLILYFNSKKRLNFLENEQYKLFLNSSNTQLDIEVKKLLDENNIVQAVKVVRETTNMNLLYSKQYVDHVKKSKNLI